jgi:ABC-type antimicrobial peptide transport system ATPase subunit
MATVKRGVLAPSPQWAKHLRDWKRFFWKRHRKAEQREAWKEVES